MLVNDQLYYAGDSFTIPEGVEVDVLATPAGAPWMKIAETMDYVLAVKPKRSFATHEMVLARAGKDMSNARIKWATEQNGGEFFATGARRHARPVRAEDASGPSVVWFRDDLRVADNPALLDGAASTGRPVVCVYVWDEESPGTPTARRCGTLVAAPQPAVAVGRARRAGRTPHRPAWSGRPPSSPT